MALNTNNLVIGKNNTPTSVSAPPPAPKKLEISGITVTNLVVLNKQEPVKPVMPAPAPKPEPVKRVSAFMADMTTVHKI